MPQGLPTSDSVPMFPPQNLITAGHNTSTTNTVLIKTETVLTSMCETLRSSSTSHSITSQPSKTIDLVVVPSTSQSTPVCVAQIGTNTVTTPAICQYRLSEIVSREKDVLFQSDKDQDLELEPPREDVYSVRRRSRQFFTLMEEEEGDTLEKTNIPALLDDMKSEDEKPVHVNPVLNLGDSLKRLYFPNQYGKHKPKKHRKRKEKGEKEKITESSNGYSSDPGGRLGLCDIISNVPELCKFQSHPELSEVGDMQRQMDDALAKSKSLPATPRVSPKLMRRNSSQVDLQGPSPGLSFLASVAGELHLNKRRQEQKLEQGLVKVSDAHLISSKCEAKTVVAIPQTDTSVSPSSGPSSRDTHTHHVNDFSDYTSSDLDSHTPAFVKSFLHWGTHKKVTVTNKESNMFFPTSF